jgi:four helix bundle protein
MAIDHEKPDVYQRALDFAVVASALCEALPRGKGYLADQLLSIVLNIAEGAGKFHGRDKSAFYARAHGSTMECAAILDICSRLKFLDCDACLTNKGLLERIGQMLTRLAQVHQANGQQRSESESGSFTFTGP